MADTEDSREKARARTREWMRVWRAANPGLNAAKQRKWRAENPARGQFLAQKGDAKRRGIPFLLTFEEWLDIWQASGKWEQRGKLAGQYVMARYGDVGPYAIGNVRICTFGDNVREAQCGRVVSSETRAKHAESLRRNPQPKDKASGRFKSRHGTNSL